MRAYRTADQSYVMIFDFLRLPFVAAMAFVMFGEVVDLWTWAGAALIIGSALYIARREAVLAKRAKMAARVPTTAPADPQAIPATRADRPEQGPADADQHSNTGDNRQERTPDA